MKNIMIKEDVYERLKDMKDDKSFSELLGGLANQTVETRRKSLRSYFGSFSDKESKEMEKVVVEVLRIAKGRLF